MNAAGFACLLQRFFTERLLEQQGASSHTVASYRDTFRLLLRFATQQLRRAPSKLRMEDLDASFMEKFLRHIERDRANSARTRNTRLSALHAFFRFVAINRDRGKPHTARPLPHHRAYGSVHGDSAG
jgi:site-specific recombinase XerD